MRTRAPLLAMTILSQAAMADQVFQLGVVEVNENAAQNYVYEEGFYEQGRNYFANLNVSY